jgi:hypothetical protein
MFMSKAKSPKKQERYNAETGLRQVSVWLNDADVQTLREIGERPDVEREWSWLARKAIRQYIERDEQLQAKQAAFESELDATVKPKS